MSEMLRRRLACLRSCYVMRASLRRAARTPGWFMLASRARRGRAGSRRGAAWLSDLVSGRGPYARGGSGVSGHNVGRPEMLTPAGRLTGGYLLNFHREDRAVGRGGVQAGVCLQG